MSENIVFRSESIIFITRLSMPDAAITLTDKDKDKCPRTITFARPYADEPVTMPVSVAAAAPEMLRLLKRARYYMDLVRSSDIAGDDPLAGVMDEIDAVIAQADGSFDWHMKYVPKMIAACGGLERYKAYLAESCAFMAKAEGRS